MLSQEPGITPDWPFISFTANMTGEVLTKCYK